MDDKIWYNTDRFANRQLTLTEQGTGKQNWSKVSLPSSVSIDSIDWYSVYVVPNILILIPTDSSLQMQTSTELWADWLQIIVLTNTLGNQDTVSLLVVFTFIFVIPRFGEVLLLTCWMATHGSWLVDWLHWVCPCTFFCCWHIFVWNMNRVWSRLQR